MPDKLFDNLIKLIMLAAALLVLWWGFRTLVLEPMRRDQQKEVLYHAE